MNAATETLPMTTEERFFRLAELSLENEKMNAQMRVMRAEHNAARTRHTDVVRNKLAEVLTALLPHATTILDEAVFGRSKDLLQRAKMLLQSFDDAKQLEKIAVHMTPAQLSALFDLKRALDTAVSPPPAEAPENPEDLHATRDFESDEVFLVTDSEVVPFPPKGVPESLCQRADIIIERRGTMWAISKNRYTPISFHAVRDIGMLAGALSKGDLSRMAVEEIVAKIRTWLKPASKSSGSSDAGGAPKKRSGKSTAGKKTGSKGRKR